MSERDPETATVGDWIELTAHWQDASGIPLFACAAGDQFQVLAPDMTTGGVVVYYDETDYPGMAFSLSPEQYKIIDGPTSDEDGDEEADLPA